MTAHELAKKLLEVPDAPVYYLDGDDYSREVLAVGVDEGILWLYEHDPNAVSPVGNGRTMTISNFGESMRPLLADLSSSATSDWAVRERAKALAEFDEERWKEVAK